MKYFTEDKNQIFLSNKAIFSKKNCIFRKIIFSYSFMFDGFVPIGTISAVVVIVPTFFVISIFLFKKNNKAFARLLSVFSFVAILVGISADMMLFSKQSEKNKEEKTKKEKKIPAFNKDTTTYKEDLEEDLEEDLDSLKKDSLKIKENKIKKDGLQRNTVK